MFPAEITTFAVPAAWAAARNLLGQPAYETGRGRIGANLQTEPMIFLLRELQHLGALRDFSDASLTGLMPDRSQRLSVETSPDHLGLRLRCRIMIGDGNRLTGNLSGQLPHDHANHERADHLDGVAIMRTC